MIVIMTNPEDFHSFLVQEALREKDIKCALWHVGDLPRLQELSIEHEPTKGVTSEMHGPELSVRGDSVDTIWFRRPKSPILPDELHPLDRRLAFSEINHLYRAFLLLSSLNAFWVNPREAAGRANLKPFQLYVASQEGLEIPPTLFSNSPERIRAFIQRAAGAVIYKACSQEGWWKTKDGGVAAVYTATITEKQLPADDILKTTGGIFQPVIHKSYELRVTVIGDRIFPVRLLSQSTAGGKLDWRIVGATVPAETTEIPSELKATILRVTRRLGLVFGCFDFIVTPDGRYVFLEVNEAGQFLWVEELTGIPLLDAFCEFLRQGRVDFKWKKSKNSVKVSDFAERAERCRQEAMQTHVFQEQQIPDEREFELQNEPAAPALRSGAGRKDPP